MDFYGKWLAYFYALSLSLWVMVIPMGETSVPIFQAQELSTSTEKISSFDQPGPSYLINQNTQYYAGKCRTDAEDNDIHFFNKGSFQYLFLKNRYATALSFINAKEINFEFIDLIYPFHYFW